MFFNGKMVGNLVLLCWWHHSSLLKQIKAKEMSDLLAESPLGPGLYETYDKASKESAEVVIRQLKKLDLLKPFWFNMRRGCITHPLLLIQHYYYFQFCELIYYAVSVILRERSKKSAICWQSRFGVYLDHSIISIWCRIHLFDNLDLVQIWSGRYTISCWISSPPLTWYTPATWRKKAESSSYRCIWHRYCSISLVMILQTVL